MWVFFVPCYMLKFIQILYMLINNCFVHSVNRNWIVILNFVFFCSTLQGRPFGHPPLVVTFGYVVLIVAVIFPSYVQGKYSAYQFLLFIQKIFVHIVILFTCKLFFIMSNNNIKVNKRKMNRHIINSIASRLNFRCPSKYVNAQSSKHYPEKIFIIKGSLFYCVLRYFRNFMTVRWLYLEQFSTWW